MKTTKNEIISNKYDDIINMHMSISNSIIISKYLKILKDLQKLWELLPSLEKYNKNIETYYYNYCIWN